LIQIKIISKGWSYAFNEKIVNNRRDLYVIKYESCVLYYGFLGKYIERLIGKSQVSVHKNDSIPEWHSIDKNMTTEIMISVPDN